MTSAASGEGSVGGGEVVGQLCGDGWSVVVAASWFGPRFVSRFHAEDFVEADVDVAVGVVGQMLLARRCPFDDQGIPKPCTSGGVDGSGTLGAR